MRIIIRMCLLSLFIVWGIISILGSSAQKSIAQTESVYKYYVRVIYFPETSNINGKSADGWFNVCPIHDEEAHESASFCTTDYYSQTFLLSDLGLDATYHYNAAESLEYANHDNLMLYQSFVISNGVEAYQRECKVLDDPNLFFVDSNPRFENFRPYPNTCITTSLLKTDMFTGMDVKSLSAYIYPIRLDKAEEVYPQQLYLPLVMVKKDGIQIPVESPWVWKLRQTAYRESSFLEAQQRDCTVGVDGIDWAGCDNSWKPISDTEQVNYSSVTEYHFLGLPPAGVQVTSTIALYHRQSVTYKTTIEGDSAKTHACEVNMVDGTFNWDCPFKSVPNVFNFPAVTAYDAYILSSNVPLALLDQNGVLTTTIAPSPKCGAPTPLPCNFPYF